MATKFAYPEQRFHARFTGPKMQQFIETYKDDIQTLMKKVNMPNQPGTSIRHSQPGTVTGSCCTNDWIRIY